MSDTNWPCRVAVVTGYSGGNRAGISPASLFSRQPHAAEHLDRNGNLPLCYDLSTGRTDGSKSRIGNELIALYFGPAMNRPQIVDVDRRNTQFSFPGSIAMNAAIRRFFEVGAYAAVVVVAINLPVPSGVAAATPREPDFHDVSALNSHDVNRIDAWLERSVETAHYPSLSVTIVRNGEIGYSKAFGFADIAEERLATPQTPYRVASVTKAFTATLAALLDEQGVISLDAPATQYLPTGVSISTTANVGATITLRQLASHTSGLPRGVPGRVQTVEGRYDLEPGRLYKHLARVKLDSEPGSSEQYSNLGFGLLGHVLERAAGKPFDRLVAEHICAPLNLRETSIEVDDKLRPAVGYGSRVPREEQTHSYRERLAGSGGLMTSSEDLGKFLAAHMSAGVFSAEVLEQLHTASLLSDGTEARTALGWSIRSSDYVGTVVQKNGGRSNCSAWIGFAPNYNVGVAVVTNCGDPDVDSLGRWLLVRACQGAHQPVTKYGFAKVAPFTGVRWQDGQPAVEVDGQWRSLVSINGISTREIVAFANEEFDAKAQMRFAEDLVEVLSRMGHDPDWNVTLGLENAGGGIEVLEKRMTESNRRSVRNRNRQ